MGLTTFKFLCFLACTIFIYYILPKKYQWTFLLGVSIAYFLLANAPFLIVYPFVAIVITYSGALFIKQTDKQYTKKLILCCTVVLDVGMLAVLKYFNPGEWLIPLGISFYTFSLLGYLFDVYYELGEVEKNPFRLALFGMFFSNMISGPIMRYRDVENSLFKEHSFDYQRVCFGCQRILWGFFKKLVISERIAIIVNAVFAEPEAYSGGYILLAIFSYTIQLYTDFSGCMDIVMGVGETLGIRLPENFNHPFAATTIQEFWRRWHITLGTWLKDYLFYPLLRTDFFMNLPMRLREKVGKRSAKRITTFLAMFILWFTIGLWHGGAVHFIIGTGILQWFYIVVGELIEPFIKKMCAKYNIDRKSSGYQLMQRLKTFVLMSFAFLFFRAPDMKTASDMLHKLFCAKGWMLFGERTLELGLDIYEWIILMVSLGIFAVVSRLSYKADNRDYIRNAIADKPIVLRWVIWYTLLFYVILLGQYGPGYSASEFIYQGF